MLNICSNVETLTHPNPLLQSFDVTKRKRKDKGTRQLENPKS
jgi:hypothetical protein